MKRKSIYNFNHIHENFSEYEVSELKAFYRHYDKKYWLFKQTFKYHKKIDLACSIGTVALIATGTIVGGATLNPIVLGTISGAGLVLKTFSEIKNFQRKIEMSKFAFTTCEKVLTEIRSFLPGAEFD